MNECAISRMPDISNYYGGLSVKEEAGKFFWSIENYDGENWYEIPASLYAELMSFSKRKESA